MNDGIQDHLARRIDIPGDDPSRQWVCDLRSNAIQLVFVTSPREPFRTPFCLDLILAEPGLKNKILFLS
jgi:hypothetical protein